MEMSSLSCLRHMLTLYPLLSRRLVPERADDTTWDDDLLDDRFRASALVLPHRPYLLQSSEFRQKDHDAYMGSFNGPKNQPEWNAEVEVKKAKVVHFNDYPLPKPWIMWPIDGLTVCQYTIEGFVVFPTI